MTDHRTAAEVYAGMTSAWLERMRLVKATQRDFYEGLRAALEEIEIEIQACKETME